MVVCVLFVCGAMMIRVCRDDMMCVVLWRGRVWFGVSTYISVCGSCC